MKCIKCKADNTEGKNYCGDCGAPLDPSADPIKEFIVTELRQQIQHTFAENYKDQKVVEIETTQAIVTRLSNWAKLLGFFVGIPVTVLFLTLGFLGFKNYSDISNLIQAAKEEITPQIDKAKKQTQEAQQKMQEMLQEGSRIEADYDKLRSSYKTPCLLFKTIWEE